MIAPLVLSIGAFALAPQSDVPETSETSDLPAEMAADPGPSTLFTAELKAGAWLPRLGGDVELGSDTNSSPSSISLEDQLDLDDLETVFNWELTLQPNSHWIVRVYGFEFSTESSGTMVGTDQFGSLILNPGDPISGTVDLVSYGAEFGWSVLDATPDGSNDPRATGLHFDAIVGGRYLDVDHTMQTSMGRESTGGEWGAVYAGLELHGRISKDEGLPLAEGLDLYSSIAIGPAFGGDGGFMWQIRSDVTLWLTEQVAFMFGYRLLELNVEDGRYEFDAGLQGLIVGGAIRF